MSAGAAGCTTPQGWLTEDSGYFLFNDELDEQSHTLNTTTYILDVTSLTEPVVQGAYVHGTLAIDIYPADDSAGFNGAWSSYPFFASGTVMVSGIEQGLFVLRPAVPTR